MATEQDLRRTLLRIDGKGYKAYQDLRGHYELPGFTLFVDHVQGDPFAPPSRLRVRVPQERAGFSPELFANKSREVALRDFLTRAFDRWARKLSSRRGTGKSGLLAVDPCYQQILEKSSVIVTDGWVEARFVVGLPAAGRRVLGREALALLTEALPQIVERTLCYQNLDAEALRKHLEAAEDADAAREQLASLGLIAFVVDGAVLPRRSGVDDRPLPLSEGAIPFRAPDSLRVELKLPNRGRVTGMGIPEGVTLIVGGGYHGKSTLLRALERGIYNHIPGDGRELVVTNPDAVKIRAEDGRRVEKVNISPFIRDLPGGRSTRAFSTENASGSTSQAANIMEALEAGAKALLIDEDTSATNFLIRDRRMQALIAKEHEPITPLLDKIRSLYRDLGVSTVLVMGGSGDYFDVADTVIAMIDFLPQDVTPKAKEIARTHHTGRRPEGGERFGEVTPRAPLPESLDPSRGRRDVKLRVRDVDEFLFGTEEVDLSAVEQIVHPSQVRAIAEAMVYAKRRYMDGRRTLREILDLVMRDLSAQGLDVLTRSPRGDLARFRRHELAAAINRLRTLEVRVLEDVGR